MGLEGIIHVANSKPALSKFVDKLREFHSEFRERVGESYKPSADGINVLCHNDFHLKNLLFKNGKNGKSDDFYLVSFIVLKTKF